MPRNVLISVRRDDAENWTSINPILESGEFGYENISEKVKLGDGLTDWNNLRYLPDILHDNVVSNRVLRDSAGLSVVGRSFSDSGDPGDIIATQDDFILRRTGSSLDFGILDTEHFANQAVSSSKIYDGTIDDDEVSENAEINPLKLGPGNLPIYISTDTDNYINNSVTVDKLNNDISEDGVGVWRTYPLKMYVIHPRYFYGYFYGALPWWQPFYGIYRLRRPYRYFIAPLPDLDVAKDHEGIEILYSKYCIINDTCYVNVLVRLTNKRQFQSVVFFNLPVDPVAPDNTIIGSAYHLNSDTPRNMPPLRAIKLENEAVGFMAHRFRWDYYWYWEQAFRAYYAGVFEFPDRFSFNLKYEIARTPLQDALIPTFSQPLRTKDGFKVNITNYDPNFTYTGYAGQGNYLFYYRRFWFGRQYIGKVTFGQPEGNILPITVKDLRWRQRSVLVIRTVREGYNDGLGWISGRAHYWWWPYPYWPWPGL